MRRWSASISSDARAAAQRAAAGLRTVVATGARQGVVTTAVFAPDGRSVISGGPDGVEPDLGCGRWPRARRPARRRALADQHQRVQAGQAAPSPLTRTKARGSGNLAASNKLVRTLSLARGQVAAAACSPDGKSGDHHRRGRHRGDLGRAQRRAAAHLERPHRPGDLGGRSRRRTASWPPPDPAITPRGSGTSPPARRSPSWKGHTGNVVDIDFSPDSTRVATALFDHTGRIWDAATGAPKLVLAGARKRASTPGRVRARTARRGRHRQDSGRHDPALGRHHRPGAALDHWLHRAGQLRFLVAR